MPTIRCSAPLITVGSQTLVRLPKAASARLPSRGMTVVAGTINGVRFVIPLEPDGQGSHWFGLSKSMQKDIEAKPGDTITLEMEPAKEWPEPQVPGDIKKGLAENPKVQRLWNDITPAARWDWIRWIRATNNPDTRQKRIVVACSKLKAGMRRPCCFNRNMCTEPSVSKNGVLLE